MGLDVSHDCWNGSYSAFMRFRAELAKAAGLPPLKEHAGYSSIGGLQFDVDDPLTTLLDHSDSEGEIPWQKCEDLATRLEELALRLPEYDSGHCPDYRVAALRFAEGLRDAFEAQENVEFY